jgi:zeaxanthin glucosyltransferase
LGYRISLFAERARAFGEDFYAFVSRYTRQRASVCITHAGLNTVLESLSHGIPQVAIPISFDQPGVAARIIEKQTGLVVPAQSVTSDRLASSLDHVINDGIYREGWLL